MRWLSDWRHAARKGHMPEWVELGGLLACVRCVKGGHRRRNLYWAPALATRPLT